MNNRLPDVPLRRPQNGFSEWNRRLHYFIGLYFLFFLWLFALTGLLLNHGTWQFAEFWPKRKIERFDRDFAPVPAGSPLAQAHHVMQELGISGELQWVTNTPAATRLDFRVARPGRQFDIKADLAGHRASVERIDVNAWGAMRALHTFTGVRANDRRNERDWWLTTVWALAMDAVALGLVAMVVSGILIWYRSSGRRAVGFLALGAGVVTCGWFVVGLAWFFA